jgi:hypothetical protein
LYEREKKQRKREKRDDFSRRLTEAFREKVKDLPHPSFTHRDLVGWIGMVYTSLPEGEFTNQDMYVYEDVFRQKYPDNRNIRAKIRQQLQSLRDWGLVEHLGQSRWRKL